MHQPLIRSKLSNTIASLSGRWPNNNPPTPYLTLTLNKGNNKAFIPNIVAGYMNPFLQQGQFPRTIKSTALVSLLIPSKFIMPHSNPHCSINYDPITSNHHIYRALIHIPKPSQVLPHFILCRNNHFKCTYFLSSMYCHLYIFLMTLFWRTCPHVSWLNYILTNKCWSHCLSCGISASLSLAFSDNIKPWALLHYNQAALIPWTTLSLNSTSGLITSKNVHY